ncbi:MAG: hypothetical protein ACLR0N_18960 [Bilophila wadsworthia]
MPEEKEPTTAEEPKTPRRLFIPITRETLPRVSDKYPFIYLERGRLEIDDSSIKWIDADGNRVRLPIATINALLLGPGTSVTHEAIKIASAANCAICWVGEDSLLFYASGVVPTNTRNLQRQAWSPRTKMPHLPSLGLSSPNVFPMRSLRARRCRK